MTKQEQIKIELDRAKSLSDFFDVVTKYYDTTAPLSTIAHTTIRMQLPKLIILTNVKLKS